MWKQRVIWRNGWTGFSSCERASGNKGDANCDIRVTRSLRKLEHAYHLEEHLGERSDRPPHRRITHRGFFEKVRKGQRPLLILPRLREHVVIERERPAAIVRHLLNGADDR